MSDTPVPITPWPHPDTPVPAPAASSPAVPSELKYPMDLPTGPIELGDTVIDFLSGFKGTAVEKTIDLNGNIRFGIQPYLSADSGPTMPDAMMIDESSLRLVEKGIVKPKKPADTFVELGDKVKDRITGLKGIVTVLSYSFNGCVFAHVVPKVDPKNPTGPLSKPTMIQVFRLDILKEKVFSVPKKADHEPTGGPNERIRHQPAQRL